VSSEQFKPSEVGSHLLALYMGSNVCGAACGLKCVCRQKRVGWNACMHKLMHSSVGHYASLLELSTM
jgi:hypothetical protein